MNDGSREIKRCTDCGHRLYFHEREPHPQTLCFACASRRRIVRICDRPNLMYRRTGFGSRR